MRGYIDPRKPDGKGRLRGAGFWFAQLGLYGTTIAVGVQMLRGTLW